MARIVSLLGPFLSAILHRHADPAAATLYSHGASSLRWRSSTGLKFESTCTTRSSLPAAIRPDPPCHHRITARHPINSRSALLRGSRISCCRRKMSLASLRLSESRFHTGKRSRHSRQQCTSLRLCSSPVSCSGWHGAADRPCRAEAAPAGSLA